MNFFYLSTDPEERAIFLCDQHLNSQIKETAQILSTAHRVLYDGPESHLSHLYRRTHVNHPVNRWVRESAANYALLSEQFSLYLNEYAIRKKRLHGSHGLCKPLLHVPVKLLDKDSDATTPPNCTTFKHVSDVVEAYRLYYREKLVNWLTRTNKRKIVPTWTLRGQPEWLNLESR